jgi:hypothetical protein
MSFGSEAENQHNRRAGGTMGDGAQPHRPAVRREHDSDQGRCRTTPRGCTAPPDVGVRVKVPV